MEIYVDICCPHVEAVFSDLKKLFHRDHYVVSQTLTELYASLVWC
jgi:hypothetical protein